MSLKSFIIEVEEGAEAELKKLFAGAKSFLIEEGQKAVALAKQSDLGTRALNLVSDLEASGMSGPDKITKLLADVEDDYRAFLTAGGFKGLLGSFTASLREFGESVVTDFKAAL